MTFYKAIAPFYDRIFPLNQNALSFLLTSFHQGESILDIGAGSGSMAIALSEKGLKVTALEPEETMAESIHFKAKSKGLSLSVTTKSMEQVDHLSETFHGMYCIGNTLAHLPDLAEIDLFLQKCYKMLREKGNFILQLVNYDKVLTDRDFSFPVTKKEDFTFMRQYEQKEGRLAFTTTLTTSEQTLKNTVFLYPLTSQQLVTLLKKAGFQTVQAYGNYNGENYFPDSQALIVVAKK